MKARMLCVIAALSVAVSGLVACKDENSAKLVVQYATMTVIEKGHDPAEKLARAQKIREIAGDASALLKGDTVTINLLQAAVHEQIEKLKLAPQDEFLANSLVTEVVDELESKLGSGVLNEDQRFKVATVLDWVVTGTAYIGT